MRIQVTGTNTCGMVALSRFGYIGVNEAAKDKAVPESLVSDVREFIRYKIITSEQSGSYKSLSAPLEHVMQAVEKFEGLYSYHKVYVCTLNETQFYAKAEYWPAELEKWGFKLTSKFKNLNGCPNYFFIRIPEKLEMEG